MLCVLHATMDADQSKISKQHGPQAEVLPGQEEQCNKADHALACIARQSTEVPKKTRQGSNRKLILDVQRKFADPH